MIKLVQLLKLNIEIQHEMKTYIKTDIREAFKLLVCKRH